MRPLVARLAAPAAFLLAVTVAVLLIRSSLGDDEASPRRVTTTETRRATPPVLSTGRRTTTAPAAAQEFYEIRAGDTLGTVASRYETTVEAIVGLNPGIDPVGLQVGQRVRVK
jgi:LysM repeat protein